MFSYRFLALCHVASAYPPDLSEVTASSLVVSRDCDFFGLDKSGPFWASDGKRSAVPKNRRLSVNGAANLA